MYVIAVAIMKDQTTVSTIIAWELSTVLRPLTCEILSQCLDPRVQREQVREQWPLDPHTNEADKQSPIYRAGTPFALMLQLHSRSFYQELPLDRARRVSEWYQHRDEID